MITLHEQWKSVVSFPDYEVSSYGQVRSIDRFVKQKDGQSGTEFMKPVKGKQLKPNISKFGYYQLTLFKNKQRHYRLVHRIVADAFLEEDVNRDQVNHKDYDKANNNVLNLEWASASENMKHSFQRSEMIRNLKLSDDDVIDIRKDETSTWAKLAQVYGVTPKAIRDASLSLTYKYLPHKDEL